MINFAFWLHFITPPYQAEALVLGRALALIQVTATIGYIVGHIIGAIWNAVHRA